MYDVFKKNRVLKLIGLALGLFVVLYLLDAFNAFYGSRNVSLASMVGFYSYQNAHQVTINANNTGRMVSEALSVPFEFTYSAGTFSCSSSDKLFVWEMKAVNGSNLFNGYDRTYLYRQQEDLG